MARSILLFSIYLSHDLIVAGTPRLSNHCRWPAPVITFTTGVSGTIMQSFLLYRFWRLLVCSMLDLWHFFLEN